MEEGLKEIGGKFARAIIAQDVEAARACLAPWLRETFSAEKLKSVLSPRYEGMPDPADFSLEGNPSTLEDLEPDEFGPLTKPLPSEITQDNYRKWMVIEFTPDPEEETGYDACLDLWMAIVEIESSLKVGYFEPADPD